MRASKTDLKEIREDAVKLEHRLTVIEGNQFTQQDRKCLQETDLKMSLFWEAIKEDFPSLLKHAHTPKFDALLDKAKQSIGSLTSKEATELIKMLTSEIEEAKQTEQPARAAIAAFYRSVLKYEVKQENKPTGCQ